MPSKIEWTDATYNPVSGCTPISAGCERCFAKRMAKRLQAMGRPGYENGFDVTLHPDKLEQPLHWRKPRMVFVCSMGDLFHKDVPEEYVPQVFSVMARCHRHLFQLSTKRPERMRHMLAKHFPFGIPHNIWAGVTCENQATADERIHILRDIPAAVRWVSFEPLLEPVSANFAGIDWIVIGCETGPGRRPCELDWVRALLAEARGPERVAVFIKKLENIYGNPTGDMGAWPKDLRVREWPRQLERGA